MPPYVMLIISQRGHFFKIGRFSERKSIACKYIENLLLPEPNISRNVGISSDFVPAFQRFWKMSPPE